MNERVASIRSRALRNYWGPETESEQLRNESFAQTEGEPDVMRHAKAFAHYCRNRAVVIYENELVVGASAHIGHHPSEPTKRGIFGRQPFKTAWKVTDDVRAFFTEGILSGAGNHTTLDYETVLRIGFTGLVDRVDERAGRLDTDDPDYNEKRDFLAALKITAEGWIDLSARYGERALAMANETADPDHGAPTVISGDSTRELRVRESERRRELETIGQICKRTPANPPTDFREACQALWFCFFFLPDAPGRVDLYLDPFYRHDIERGAITREEAHELLSCLWIKYFEYMGAAHAVSAINHLTLGGVHPDGSDASSETTYLCLDVTEDLRLNRPQVGLRWNRNTPPDLLRHAVKVLRTQSGNPDFCNDEVIVPALVGIGVEQEDARDFTLSGCHEVIVTGRAQMGSVEGFINLPKSLRIALGMERGLSTGTDPSTIESYEDLWNALSDALELVADAAHDASIARDSQAAEETGQYLSASLVVRDCIENVSGYTQGGARYNYCNWNIIGMANLADSIAAIKTLVFDEKTLTLPQLIGVLENDWEGQESLRQRVVNRMSHYGNDNDEVDAIAGRVIETVSTIMKRRTPFRGGQYCLGTLAGGENMHVEFGRVTGATPDGRAAGATFSDSAGPVQGHDRKGITAMLNSVAKLPHELLPTAVSLNVKLDPKLLDDDTGIDKIASLIEGHFLTGGQQCQFNMVNREMLLEARRNPENHGDLTVRVAGYSAPFTALWDDLQDEIIARTEHEA
jgi:pyruvate-formate lyase